MRKENERLVKMFCKIVAENSRNDCVCPFPNTKEAESETFEKYCDNNCDECDKNIFKFLTDMFEGEE